MLKINYHRSLSTSTIWFWIIYLYFVLFFGIHFFLFQCQMKIFYFFFKNNRLLKNIYKTTLHWKYISKCPIFLGTFNRSKPFHLARLFFQPFFPPKNLHETISFFVHGIYFLQILAAFKTFQFNFSNFMQISLRILIY